LGLEILFEILFYFCFGVRILMKLQLLKKHLTLFLQQKRKKKRKTFVCLHFGFLGV